MTTNDKEWMRNYMKAYRAKKKAQEKIDGKSKEIVKSLQPLQVKPIQKKKTSVPVDRTRNKEELIGNICDGLLWDRDKLPMEFFRTLDLFIRILKKRY